MMQKNAEGKIVFTYEKTDIYSLGLTLLETYLQLSFNELSHIIITDENMEDVLQKYYKD